MLNAEAKKTVWMPLVDKGLILPLRLPPELEDDARPVVDLRVTKNAPGWPLPVELTLPAVQPHLENFVAAIRGAQRLSDPIGQSYANLVGIEGALRSARERRTIDFQPQDFVA